MACGGHGVCAWAQRNACSASTPNSRGGRRDFGFAVDSLGDERGNRHQRRFGRCATASGTANNSSGETSSRISGRPRSAICSQLASRCVEVDRQAIGRRAQHLAGGAIDHGERLAERPFKRAQRLMRFAGQRQLDVRQRRRTLR